MLSQKFLFIDKAAFADYHSNTAAAYTNPPPKPTVHSFCPRVSFPARSACARQIGMQALDMFPYSSMLI